MKRRNAVPPIMGAVCLTALAVVMAHICDDDATASAMFVFFAIAMLIEAADRIRTNVRIMRRYRVQK